MPPSTCQICNAARAVIIRPKNRHKLCKSCFLAIFEAEIHETIVSTSLFQRGERIAIGASGGKDSTVLAAVLKTLNERYDYGLDMCLLSIDEGIKGYRDDSLETVKRNAEQYAMPLTIVGYGELYGWTMDQVVSEIGKRGNCTYCGVFRRQALDRGAARLDIKHVVTGHNADDVAETVMMNLLRGDLARLARGTSIVTASGASDIKRSKPLKYAYEKEIVLYAYHRKLDYFSTECIYSPEAFRGSARTLIKDLEKIRPSSIMDIVRSGEDMAELVPPEVSNNRTGAGPGGGEPAKPAAAAGDGEDYSMGGCGNQNESGGGNDDMASMEKRLAEDSSVKHLETEVTMPKTCGTQCEPKPRKKPIKTQTMRHCERCGYISSQALCKACVLIEGLNKTRPRQAVEIEIDVADEDSSSTLMRQMERIDISNSASTRR